MEFKTLSNGVKMPLIGLGTWLADNEEELVGAMEAALNAGYRHFDTAYIYRNEAVLGKVLKQWISSGKIKREELFIVTKLPICGIVPGKVSHFLNISLENLQLDYVDLYLIHCPFGLDSKSDDDPIPIKDGKVVIDYSTNLEGVWNSMEKQVAIGKAKSIGISNFDESQIERIVKIAKIPPANLQIELHAYSQQKTLRAVCIKHGISVCAYSPLGSLGIKEFYKSMGRDWEAKLNMLNDPLVLEIASRYGKTAAQVLLRFLVQLGVVVIPKSTNATRLKQNIQVFDFHLGNDEMKALEALDKGSEGRTFNFPSFLPGIEKHPEYPKWD